MGGHCIRRGMHPCRGEWLEVVFLHIEILNVLKNNFGYLSYFVANKCKFKIEVQFFCSVSQANTMKNTAEVCPSGRRRKAS